MSFILTAVCTGAPEAAVLDLHVHRLVIERVDPGGQPGARAGYVPGLARHLGRSVDGPAFYLLLEDDTGYRTSDEFFPTPDDDGEPIHMVVPHIYREDVTKILSQMLLASPLREVILIVEYNGSVTDPYELTIDADVLGPWDVAGFWMHHDLGEIVEDSIILLHEHVP